MSDRRQEIARFVERASAALDKLDYYQLLGVSPAATSEEIRDAYYRRASHLHPDVHGLDIDPSYRLKITAVFSRLVEAYKALSEARSRAAYDRGLASGALRLSAAREAPAKAPEDELQNGAARRFFKLSRAARDTGNLPSALMNLRLALSMEPESTLLKRELEILETGRS